MIEELKKNIDAEIEILREISTYSRRLEFATLSEDKLIRSAISSLRESIRLINKSIPELIKEVSVAKKLAVEKRQDNLEQIGFQRSESRVSVVLQVKDRDKFLNELSISENLIRRLKKKELKEDVEDFHEFRRARGYLKISNKYFLDRALKLISDGWFKSLSLEVNKANIDVLFQTYVAMMFFTAFISMFVFFFVMIFFLFFNIGFAFPFVTIYNGSYLLRFLKVFWIPLVCPVLVFAALYYYPSTEKSTLGKKIDQELPFAVIHMSAISGSGIEPSEIFRIIILGREYPFLKREVRKVLNQINLYGYDLVTSITNVAKSTSSTKLSELFSGLATTINSGGNLKEFFEKRAETLLTNYRLEREKYTKVAETFMDIYISVVIAAPMILMLLLIMVGISGFEAGYSTTGMTLIIILIIALINILFIGFLNIKQPSY